MPSAETIFRGVFAAIVTPWDHDDQVDEAALWRQIELLIGAGIGGVCAGGTTGEYPRLSAAVRKQLFQTVREMVGGRVPVLGCAGGASINAVRDALADVAGCAAALVASPIHFRYEQPDLGAYFHAVAERAPLPLLLYNIPQFSAGIEAPLAIELIESGAYAGIKDSSGNPALLDEIALLRRRMTFSFLCGADAQLPRALRLGADGAVSGIAAAVPELLLAVYTASRAGNKQVLDAAMQLLLEFIAQLELFPVPVGIRMTLEARGIPVGPHAIPLSLETEQRAYTFRQWLEDWLPRAVSLASQSPKTKAQSPEVR